MHEQHCYILPRELAILKVCTWSLKYAHTKLPGKQMVWSITVLCASSEFVAAQQ